MARNKVYSSTFKAQNSLSSKAANAPAMQALLFPFGTGTAGAFSVNGGLH